MHLLLFLSRHARAHGSATEIVEGDDIAGSLAWSATQPGNAARSKIMLNKWIPLRRERLGQEIDRAFDRIWQEGRRGLTEYPSSLEVGEEDDRYILRMDVPGMSRDDLLVYLEGD
ncbi:MAG TPA: Hsp20/alpha crystallin family protein, partial [Trueperaceae bacterium]